MYDWDKLNPEVIAESRANGGEVSHFGGLSIVILHTVGARSGKIREIPLIPVYQGEDTLVFATKAGSPKHPDWYFNLKAQPRIDVELGGERFTADVVEVDEPQAEAIRQEQARVMKQFAEYLESAAPRVVPVFKISRV